MIPDPGLRDGGAGSVVARVAGGLALLVAAGIVLRPFVVPILWAGILAYATWPLFRWLRHHTRRPRLAAAAFTLAVALCVGVPVTWVIVALAGEANLLIGQARAWLDAGAPFPDLVLSRPWLAERLLRLREESLIEPTAVFSYVTRNAAALSGRLVEIAGGLATNVFKFTIMVVTLFVFYTDGERLAEHSRRLAQVLFPHTRHEVMEHIGGVVRAVVFGLLGTALVQGTVAGIGFALFGVPSPVALGALTFAGSFVPAGPMLIWGGAALWLLAGERPYAAAGMAVYGMLLISSIDNVLRPLLISGGSVRVPFLLVFFGVLGGLAAFGMLGLFLGPVILSIAFALVVEFAQREATSSTPAG